MLRVEGKVKELLASLSPSEAVQSKVLQASFKEFFSRGTQSECEQLLPDVYKVLSSTPAPQKSIAPRKSTQAPRKGTTSDEISQYFLQKGLYPSRKLIDAANGLARATKFSDAEYEALWTPNDPVCSPSRDTDAFERLRGVIQRIDKLQNAISLFDCALRFSLLFLSHQVDQIAGTVPKEELEPGIGRKTIAIDKIVRECKVARDKIEKLLKRSKNYFLIAEEGGIGSLLEMGSFPTTWESLTNAEIDSLLGYRRDRLPTIESRSQQLDIVAAHIMIEGLRKNGWKDSELSKSGSRLMKLLGRYVDLDHLAYGRVVMVEFSTGVLGEVDESMMQQFPELTQLTGNVQRSGIIHLGQGGNTSQLGRNTHATARTVEAMQATQPATSCLVGGETLPSRESQASSDPHSPEEPAFSQGGGRTNTSQLHSSCTQMNADGNNGQPLLFQTTHHNKDSTSPLQTTKSPPARKRRRLLRESPTVTTDTEPTSARSTPDTRNNFSVLQQYEDGDGHAREGVAETDGADTLAPIVVTEIPSSSETSMPARGTMQPVNPVVQERVFAMQTYSDRCDDGNVTEAFGMALMNVATEPSPHFLSPTQVRGAIAGDQPMEPMSPPSAVMTEYWQTGDWDLFT